MGVEITPWLVVIDRTLQVVHSWVSGQSPEVLAARTEKYRAAHRCDIIVETSEGLTADWLREDYEVGHVECYSRDKRDLCTTALSYSCKPANFGGLLEGVVTFQLLKLVEAVAGQQMVPNDVAVVEEPCLGYAASRELAGGEQAHKGELGAPPTYELNPVAASLETCNSDAGGELASSDEPSKTASGAEDLNVRISGELPVGTLVTSQANCTREVPDALAAAQDEDVSAADEQAAGETLSSAQALNVPLEKLCTNDADCEREASNVSLAAGQVAASASSTATEQVTGEAPCNTMASSVSVDNLSVSVPIEDREALDAVAACELAAGKVEAASGQAAASEQATGGDAPSSEVVLDMEDVGASCSRPLESEARVDSPPPIHAEVLDTAVAAADGMQLSSTACPPTAMPASAETTHRGALTSTTASPSRVVPRRGAAGKRRRHSNGNRGFRPAPSTSCRAQGIEPSLLSARPKSPPAAASLAANAAVGSSWHWALAGWSRCCPFRRASAAGSLAGPPVANEPQDVTAGVPMSDAARAVTNTELGPKGGPEKSVLKNRHGTATTSAAPESLPCERVSSTTAPDVELSSITACSTVGMTSDTCSSPEAMPAIAELAMTGGEAADTSLSQPADELPKAPSVVAVGLCCIYFLVDPAGGSRFGACCTEDGAGATAKPLLPSTTLRREGQATAAQVEEDDPWWVACTRRARWGSSRQTEARPLYPTKVQFWHAAACLLFNAHERMPARREAGGVTIQAEMTSSLDAKLQVRLSCTDQVTDVQQAAVSMPVLPNPLSRSIAEGS